MELNHELKMGENSNEFKQYHLNWTKSNPIQKNLSQINKLQKNLEIHQLHPLEFKTLILPLSKKTKFELLKKRKRISIAKYLVSNSQTFTPFVKLDVRVSSYKPWTPFENREQVRQKLYRSKMRGKGLLRVGMWRGKGEKGKRFR